MKTSGRELIDVLERIAVLEWYRYSIYEQGINNPASATVVWRFDHNRTTNEQITRIISAIRLALDTVTNIEWSLKFTGRNWVLAPIRVILLEESGEFRTDGEINMRIAQEEPEYFSKAHVDLVAIANAVDCT